MNKKLNALFKLELEKRKKDYSLRALSWDIDLLDDSQTVAAFDVNLCRLIVIFNLPITTKRHS